MDPFLRPTLSRRSSPRQPSLEGHGVRCTQYRHRPGVSGTIRGCDVSTHFKINVHRARTGDAEGRDIVPANVYSRVKDVVTVFD
jgi:hypothetical protein